MDSTAPETVFTVTAADRAALDRQLDDAVHALPWRCASVDAVSSSPGTGVRLLR